MHDQFVIVHFSLHHIAKMNANEVEIRGLCSLKTEIEKVYESYRNAFVVHQVK